MRQVLRTGKCKSMILVVILLTVFLSVKGNSIVFADNDTWSISETSMVFYGGDAVQQYMSFSPSTHTFVYYLGFGYPSKLYITNGDYNASGVEWHSDDTSIAIVEDGLVQPVSYGTTRVTGTYNGKTYSCTVYVKEIRLFFLQEYTGDEQSNHWVWFNYCKAAVGQSVHYKLVEITYGPDKEESGRRDVTALYPLSEDDPDYIQVNSGSLKALKSGSGFEDTTNGLYYVFPHTGVEYVQMIRFHLITLERYNEQYSEYLQLYHENEEQFCLKDIGAEGVFTFDDEFISDQSWVLNRCTTDELTWISSDPAILSIEKTEGSKPNSGYSFVTVSPHKIGQVKLTALLDGREIAYDYIHVDYETFPSTFHYFGEWYVLKEPTSEEEGIMARDCFSCNAKETKTIDKLPPETDSPTDNSSEDSIPMDGSSEDSIPTDGSSEDNSPLENSTTDSSTEKKTQTLPALKAGKISIKIAKTKTATYKVNFAKGKTITVKSSNKKVATATAKKGNLVIKARKKSGKAKITVTANKKKAVITVTVPKVKTKKITCKAVSVKKGKKVTLKPKVTPTYSDDKVTYKSANKKIATVTAKGVVKGIKPGKTTITIKSGKKSVKVKVTVK